MSIGHAWLLSWFKNAKNPKRPSYASLQFDVLDKNKIKNNFKAMQILGFRIVNSLFIFETLRDRNGKKNSVVIYIDYRQKLPCIIIDEDEYIGSTDKNFCTEITLTSIDSNLSEKDNDLFIQVAEKVLDYLPFDLYGV